VWIGFLAGKAVADVAWYGLETYARRGVAWSAGRGGPGCGTAPAVGNLSR
jgi:hypothetical protein